MEYIIKIILELFSLIGILIGLRGYNPYGNLWTKDGMNILFLFSLIILIHLVTGIW